MTYDEILAEVIELSKRPDKTATEIPSAIRAATLKAHNSDFFYRDLVEVAVEFDLARQIQTFAPKQVVPLYRAAKYVRRWDGDINGTLGPFLDYINIENSLDGYGYVKDNVFYLAGDNIQIRAYPAIEKILFGCYRYPTITPVESYDSWVAEEYPYAIVYEAVRKIHQSVGNNEQAAQYGNMIQEEYAALKVSNVDTVAS